MTYSVAAYFTQSDWDKSGLNWIRKLKLEKLKGFIIGDLSEDTNKKISDLGLQLISNDNLGDDGHCLFVKSESFICSSLSEEFDVYCAMDKKLIPIDLVWSISNLNERVKSINLLKKVFDNYNGLFSSKYVLGSKSFWKNYNSFKKYILSQDYLDGSVMRDELMLNLYFGVFKPTLGFEE